MSDRTCACCMTCPCCPGCNLCKKCLKICGPKPSSLCWKFMFTDERNCDCCYCPHNDDTICQCCHCAFSESPNCRWCCCSCANNRNCKCLCCTEENNECQCYESRCCTFPYLPYRRGAALRRRLRSQVASKTSIISLDKEPSGHAFIDQLVCPLCQRMFVRPFMLPCNHCICDGCIMKSKLNAEITECFYIITCPVCKKAHCLPFSKRIYLRINYLRARLARKYMRRYGFLRWRFDKSYVPIYCQVCDDRRADKRCLSCQLNYCSLCLRNYHQDISFQNHAYAKLSDDIWEDKTCLIHGDSLLSKYCLDDHELICEYCADAQHGDHSKVSLPVGCSKMSAVLFATIAKFKKGSFSIIFFLLDIFLVAILCLINVNAKPTRDFSKAKSFLSS